MFGLGRKQALLILVVLALALAAGGYLFRQNQALSRELTTLSNEFTTLKNTDLARENESLKTKLKSAEENLTSEKSAHGNTKNQLATAEGKIQKLETALAKFKPYVDVLAAFNAWEYSPTSGLHILDRDTGGIDGAVFRLGDSGVSSLWSEVKAGFPGSRQTGNFRHEEVIILVTSKLSNLLK